LSHFIIIHLYITKTDAAYSSVVSIATEETPDFAAIDHVRLDRKRVEFVQSLASLLVQLARRRWERLNANLRINSALSVLINENMPTRTKTTVQESSW